MLGKYIEDLVSLPADAALAWRQRGLAGVREEIAGRTLHRVLRWGRFLVLEQDLEKFREVLPPAGVTIEEFAGDWEELREIATGREVRAFRRAAAAGRIGLVARRHGRPIGYTWISSEVDPAIEVHAVPLPADACYGWNLFVIPRERNSGTGTALVSARLGAARARGFSKGWRLVAPANLPSKRTVEKTSGGGSRHVATLSYVKLGRRIFTRYRPVDGASSPSATSR